ncbi:MAG: hypothetical protein ABI315_07510 [Bacteroidia bacterium]
MEKRASFNDDLQSLKNNDRPNIENKSSNEEITFNKLNKDIELLRQKVEENKEKVDILLNYFATKVKPLQKNSEDELVEFSKALNTIYRDKNL